MIRFNAVLVAIAILFFVETPNVAAQYDVELVSNGAVVARDGEKTCFPSVIRLPDWLAIEDRADPKAKYYFYYCQHHGRHIFMKWSESVEGPWHTFNLQGMSNNKVRHGVLDVEACPRRSIAYGHLAAPDVHVDDDNKQFIMFFHGDQRETTTKNGTILPRGHNGFVATSSNGLNFFDPKTSGGQPGHGPRTCLIEEITRDIHIGPAYMRAFWQHENLYSVSKRGVFCKAPDPKSPWAVNPNDPLLASWKQESTPSDIWKKEASKIQPVYYSTAGTFFASAEFEKHPNNPNPGVRIDSNDERVNHLCCSKLPGGLLEIFFYVKHDPEDRFNACYRVVCDISDRDFENWSVARDDKGQVIFDIVCTPEQICKMVAEANGEDYSAEKFADPISLGSTYVFTDADGQKYLFFSYVSKQFGGREGEGQISVLKLVSRKSKP